MNNFIEVLQQYPELALFLVLALGFAIGKISIGNSKVGAVLGTLFAGVIVGLIAFGIVGLFIGPVFLTVTYTVLKAWINENKSEMVIT